MTASSPGERGYVGERVVDAKYLAFPTLARLGVGRAAALAEADIHVHSKQR